MTAGLAPRVTDLSLPPNGGVTTDGTVGEYEYNGFLRPSHERDGNLAPVGTDVLLRESRCNSLILSGLLKVMVYLCKEY